MTLSAEHHNAPSMEPSTKPYRWSHNLHPSVTISKASLVVPFLHPTRVHLHHTEHDRHLHWYSRHHRKHRYVTHALKGARYIRHKTGLWAKMARMGRFEWWNVSWWLAIIFTIGSIVWTVNGFIAYLPFVQPDSFSDNIYGAGWTAFAGATIFEVGAIFGMWEAWNRDMTLDFGYQVEKLFGEEPSSSSSSPRPRVENKASPAHSGLPLNGNQKKPEQEWIWFSLDPKYWHELGFLAAFAQFCGATIFWISGFTALPQIQEQISDRTGLYDGVYWTPQVVGGSGFILSSLLIMLETQTKWYKPNFWDLGWQVGVWNLIGALGFTASGACGYGILSHKAAYQAAFSTFWGSWGFLIGSVIQWYESVNAVGE